MQIDREQTFRPGEAVVVEGGKRGWVRELTNPRAEGLHVDDWLPHYRVTMLGGREEHVFPIHELRPLEPMEKVYLDRGLTALDGLYGALAALSDLQGNAEGGPWEHEYELLEIAVAAIGRKHQRHSE